MFKKGALNNPSLQYVCMQELTLYSGFPMFFNVAREKSGRPGRSGDVIRHGLGRGYVYPAYLPTSYDHYSYLAS